MIQAERLLVSIDGQPAYPAVAVFALPGDVGLLWVAPGYLHPQAGMGGERFGGSALGALERLPDRWVVRSHGRLVEVAPFKDGPDDMLAAFYDHEQRVSAKGWEHEDQLAALREEYQPMLDELVQDARRAA